MAHMRTQGGRIADIDPILDDEVVGIVLDNGVTVWCEEGSYKEYTPVDERSAKIYILRPSQRPKTEMIGYTRHIIATYFRS